MLPRILLAACLTVAASTSQTWNALRDLQGRWIGEGSGAAGEFSFTPDLQGKVLVRRSYAEYPATKEKPAYRHDDLMVIYGDADPRAVYFDNEGHVIHYRIQAAADSVVFISDPEPSAPRFRLTYTKTAAGGLKLKFEIAPPGKPDAFAPYIEASAKRQ